MSETNPIPPTNPPADPAATNPPPTPPATPPTTPQPTPPATPPAGENVDAFARLETRLAGLPEAVANAIREATPTPPPAPTPQGGNNVAGGNDAKGNKGPSRLAKWWTGRSD